MVLELCNTDLLCFLKGIKVRKTDDQLYRKFCSQITKGMDFLSESGFIHRDLAARNILIKNKICKVRMQFAK